MKQWLVVLILTAPAGLAFGQRVGVEPHPGYTLALPTRPGRLYLDAPSTFRDVFYYATVLYDHSMMREAAPVYEQALALLPARPSVDEASRSWRRIATDQAAMSYGISGDISRSRLLLNRAIAADPDYALNYYNLACADAEEGKPDDAKTHLQQSFDRRTHVLAGESLPDPTSDDSMLKLKSDGGFWKFVEALQKNR